MQTHGEIQAARHKIQKHKSQKIQAKIHMRKAQQKKKELSIALQNLGSPAANEDPKPKKKQNGKKRQKIDNEFVE